MDLPKHSTSTLGKWIQEGLRAWKIFVWPKRPEWLVQLIFIMLILFGTFSGRVRKSVAESIGNQAENAKCWIKWKWRGQQISDFFEHFLMYKHDKNQVYKSFWPLRPHEALSLSWIHLLGANGGRRSHYKIEDLGCIPRKSAKKMKIREVPHRDFVYML